MFKPLNIVDYLKQEEATAGNILEKLESNFYDILHFAGHAEFNPKYPEESSLILHDEHITAGYIFQVVTRPPTLAFINACSSAKTTGIEYLETQGKLTGMTSAFLSSGVNAYIGTLWSVHDGVVAELSINFYQRVLKGESIGLALRNAKKMFLINMVMLLILGPLLFYMVSLIPRSCPQKSRKQENRL